MSGKPSAKAYPVVTSEAVVSVIFVPTTLPCLPVGGGASFYVLHVDPVEPIGTAPLLDPTIRNGSVRNVHLRLKSQVGLSDGLV